jgi:hypothetical protein
MVPLGWVPLDGRTVTETDFPTLFTIPALASYIQGNTPNRVMVLPNVTQRVLLANFATAGQLGGSNQIQLLLGHMPPHNHNVGVVSGGGFSLSGRTSRAGQHGHAVSGGAHGHGVNDPGHKHLGFEGPTGLNGYAICAFWGGQNKIDAYFNDRSHTYSVEMLQWTMAAYTGITISSAGSEHNHEVTQAGDHDHVTTFDPVPAHIHNVTQDTVGSGSPYNFTPAHLAVYCYIRS